MAQRPRGSKSTGSASSGDVMTQLQSTVETLREKSRSIVNRQQELAQFLKKFHEKTESRKKSVIEAKRIESKTPSTDNPEDVGSIMKYSQLSAEDKKTMQNILIIQQWLLTIKKQRNFTRFRDRIEEMKIAVFAPEQSSIRAQGRRSSLGGVVRAASSASVSAPDPEQNLSDAQKKVNKKEARDLAKTWGEDVEDKMATTLAKKQSESTSGVPQGVEFINGVWVPVDVDPEDDAFALEGISDDDFEEDDVPDVPPKKATPKPKPKTKKPSPTGDQEDRVDDLDGLSDFDDDDDETETSLNSSSDLNGSLRLKRKEHVAADDLNDIDDLEDDDDDFHGAKGSGAGPSSIVLGEFKVTDKLRAEIFGADEAHKKEFGKAFQSRRSRDQEVLDTPMQLKWLVHTAISYHNHCKQQV